MDTTEAEGQAPSTGARFGTFTGVFTPTLLTILGVIMYVRLPWVVGNAGLLGAWIILVGALGITACTGLSLSSIATNTRIGDGGPYAIVHKSLGYEVGGSVGIPLYLTRPLGTAMYIFGFREGWQWIFPGHPALAVDLIVFGVIFFLSYRSAFLAFRVQYLVMGVIALSLLSVFASPGLREPGAAIEWWGGFPGFPEDGLDGVSPWVVFAVFFPATTGILAGANMSGELKNPRRSIPQGTLWALGVSSVIYLAMAWAAARLGTPGELTSDYTLLIERAFWPPAVVAGLLGATFSSALAGSVGGARIVMAMGQHGILPRSRWLAEVAPDGEPRNAVVLTGALTLLALMVRDLNAIAPLLTMFFLITYSVINVVLLMESSLGLVSFRPSLRLPRIIPLLGAAGGVFVMFIVSPTFSLIAVLTVVAIYIWILRLGLETHGDDVRSSIFVAMAEWAAARVSEYDRSNLRAWKPNLLVPFEDPAAIRGEFNFLVDICRPEGSAKLLGLATRDNAEDLRARSARLAKAFRKKGVFTNASVVDSVSFQDGVVTGLQALQSAFFRPNLLFVAMPERGDRYGEYDTIITQARRTGVGVLLLLMHPKAGLGVNSTVNVWIREQPRWDVDEAFRLNNLNLALLTGYRLSGAWAADLRLTCLVSDRASEAPARDFLDEVCDLVRLPARTERIVLTGRFPDDLADAPQADLHLLGMNLVPDFRLMSRISEATRASCLFVADSGRESARA